MYGARACSSYAAHGRFCRPRRPDEHRSIHQRKGLPTAARTAARSFLGVNTFEAAVCECEPERTLEARDLASGTGREGAMEMINIEGIVSGGSHGEALGA